MAARYPTDWIEALRERADIVSVVSEYVPLKQNGRRYWGLCPFHNEKTASFSVDPDQGLYYCFGCKAGGTVIQFIMDAERMEFSEAVRYLAEKLRVPLPDRLEDDGKAQERRSKRERIYELNRRAARFYHETLYSPAGARVLDYLHGRGLDDPTIRLFGLGAAQEGWDALTRAFLGAGIPAEALVEAGLTVQRGENRFDMFRNRAIFPIINAHGAVLGFGGRALDGGEPKYLNTAETPAFNKRLGVYGENLLRKTRGLARVLLVEGYMDVASLARYGVAGVAATLGTALTPEQAKLLKRYAPEIWIAYDGDAPGRNAALKALDVCQSLEIPARVLEFPDGQDPDEFIRRSGREGLESLTPLPAPAYRLRRAADGMDLSTEEGRMRYAIAGAAILRSVRQPVEMENLLRRLMVETGYGREVLLQQIGVAREKTVYTKPARREKLPAAGDQFLPEHAKAERTLLSLLASGLVPPGTLTPERFEEEDHRRVAQWLLAGRKPAELLEECQDAALRGVMLEVFAGGPPPEGDKLPDMITECLEAMRRAWIDRRLKTLTDSLSSAAGDEKRALYKEIAELTSDRENLRPGRKE